MAAVIRGCRSTVLVPAWALGIVAEMLHAGVRSCFAGRVEGLDIYPCRDIPAVSVQSAESCLPRESAGPLLKPRERVNVRTRLAQVGMPVSHVRVIPVAHRAEIGRSSGVAVTREQLSL